jgi:hypothetical protein
VAILRLWAIFFWTVIWLSIVGVFLLGLSIFNFSLPSQYLSRLWLLFIPLIGLAFLLLNLWSFNFLQQLFWISFGCRETRLYMKLFSLIQLKFFNNFSSLWTLITRLGRPLLFFLFGLFLVNCYGFLKGNFDVAIRDNFAVTAAVISNSNGKSSYLSPKSFLTLMFL